MLNGICITIAWPERVMALWMDKYWLRSQAPDLALARTASLSELQAARESENSILGPSS